MAGEAIQRLYRIEVNAGKAVNQLKGINKNVTGLSKSFNKMGQSIKNAATLLAASFSVNAARGVVENASAMAKMADATGLTIKAYQELGYAAEIAGISQGQFGSNMTAFVKRVGEAQNGMGPLVSGLRNMDKALLNSVASASTQEEAFALISDAIANASSATEKAAIANAAFSRSGVGMVNMMKQGSKGLQDMSEEANALGLVMSEDLVRNAEEFDDAMLQFTKQIKIAFSASLLTGITTMGDGIKAFWQDLKDLESGAILVATAVSTVLVPAIVVGSKAIAVAIASNPIGAFLTALSVGVVAVIANWQKVKDFFEDLWPFVKQVFKGVVSELSFAIDNGALMLDKLWLHIKKGAAEAVNGIATVFTNTFNQVIITLNKLSDVLGFEEISTVKFDDLIDTKGLTAEIKAIEQQQRDLVVATKEAQQAIKDEAATELSIILKKREENARAIKEKADADAAALKAKEDAIKAADLELAKLKAISDQRDKDTQTLSDLKDKLEPARVEARALADEVAKIRDLVERGFISPEQGKDLVEAFTLPKEAVEDLKAETLDFSNVLETSLASSVDSLADSFIDFATGAKSSFSDFAKSFIVDITKMIAKMYIVQALQSAFGIGGGSTAKVPAGTTFAHGGAFDGLTGLPQGVYNKPTFFNMPGGGLHKFAKGGAFGAGMGVLAEASRSEAILPLERTLNGDLGVKSSPVNVEVNNYGNDNVEVRREGDEIKIIIAAVANDILKGGGEVSRSLQQSYGLSRAGTAY